MLRVRIDINYRNLFDLAVVRIEGDTRPNSVNTYRLDDGTFIKHRYGDGAVKLALRMLKKLAKEPK